MGSHTHHVGMVPGNFYALPVQRTEGCRMDQRHNLLHILLGDHRPSVHVDDRGADETLGRSPGSPRWGPHFLVGSAGADFEG